MLRGYKPNPWADTDDHLYVPSTKNFSLLLNYDIPTICIPAGIAFFTLIAGVATLANAVWIVGSILMAWSIVIPLALLFGYRGAKSMGRSEYNSWLQVEKAYAKMSHYDRKRHRKTLKDAFDDAEVAELAKEIFTELGVDKDLSGLKSELTDIREQKQIMRELNK